MDETLIKLGSPFPHPVTASGSPPYPRFLRHAPQSYHPPRSPSKSVSGRHYLSIPGPSALHKDYCVQSARAPTRPKCNLSSPVGLAPIKAAGHPSQLGNRPGEGSHAPEVMWAEGLASTQWPPASISRRPGGCGSAGGGPRPKTGGAPRRCPFLNTAGDGTQWDPRREKHSPLFVPLGFLVPVSQNPSWEAFSLVSGCFGGRNSTVRFGSPFAGPSGYPRPSCHKARPQGSPFFPKATSPSPPNPRGFPFSPFAAPPPRRGHNGKLSFS